MARRKHFSGSAGEHGDQARSALREIKRLVGRIRAQLKSPPDCDQAARLVVRLSQEQGVYLVNKTHGNFRRAGSYAGPKALVDRFVKTCVVKTRSPTAARKMRAVWR